MERQTLFKIQLEVTNKIAQLMYFDNNNYEIFFVQVIKTALSQYSLISGALLVKFAKLLLHKLVVV